MVVAEVPLWVAHYNNDGPSGSSQTSNLIGTDGSSGSASGNANGGSNGNGNGASSSHRHSSALRARESLSLLEGLGGGGFNGGGAGAGASTQKCAMYSIDFHPDGSKFATGGGDGKVRLWNSSQLFPLQTRRSKRQAAKADVDVDAPSTSQQQSRQQKDKDSNSNKNNGNKQLASRRRKQRGSWYDEDGKYESSGESASDESNQSGEDASISDNGSGSSDGSSSADSDSDNSNNSHSHSHSNGNGGDKEPRNSVTRDSSSQQEDDGVHDLTSLVRSKKKPNADGKANAGTNASAATDDSMDVSPSKSTPTKDQQPNSQSPSQASSKRTSRSHSTNNANDRYRRHRLLCTLSAHTGSSVLSVRFSNNGKFLASAGDDSVVCIYTQAKHSSSISGNMTDQNHVEHWTRIKLCRGHSLDVVGLAWAPDDSHLVSCSLDSNAPIIVWKLTDLATQTGRVTHDNILCSPYKILGHQIHSSTVKGVTFDPAGTYLASSGDDPCVCIWRAHDDWGLERRIDANSGIFRRWGEDSSTYGLSSQTLFRRLSWCTDGSYICTTNAVVKNKHVASMISRDGWAVSGSKSGASGAASLVGHKQPVVASRHCPHLLDARKKGQSDDKGIDDEPEYATLLALGDRSGFLTVWSTKRTRPVFKLKCSKTRSTITDIAWGRLQDNALALIVSMLDGQVVALRFEVPDEIGPILNDTDRGRIFELRYGINPIESNGRRLFVGENAAPRLIENPFQMTMENDARDDDGDGDLDQVPMRPVSPSRTNNVPMTTDQVVANQHVSQSQGGKKRIRPVLIGIEDEVLDGDIQQQQQSNDGSGAPGGTNSDADAIGNSAAKKARKDPLHAAMDAVQEAANSADAATKQRNNKLSSAATDPTSTQQQQQHESAAHTQSAAAAAAAAHATANANANAMPARTVVGGPAEYVAAPQIPISTSRVHSIDLPVRNSESRFVVECTNALQSMTGSSSSAALPSSNASISCTTVAITQDGKAKWKDQMVGASCSAVAACHDFLAVGTTDGSVQLYGTSPSTGWCSGVAFRSHPPFIYGAPVVSLQIRQTEIDRDSITPTAAGALVGANGEGDKRAKSSDILVVTADGDFVVHQILPKLKRLFKGSLRTPMNHVTLSAGLPPNVLPKLARIQITTTGRLLLLLSLGPTKRKPGPNGSMHQNRMGGTIGANNSSSNAANAGAGGSVQAFVYLEDAELWIRAADGRFVLSDFYTTVPRKTKKMTSNIQEHQQQQQGMDELASYEHAVRTGTLTSMMRGMKRKNRREQQQQQQPGFGRVMDASLSDYVTRAHCEDRMACAVCLGSKTEFQFWLGMYSKILAAGSHETQIRVLADMLLGRTRVSDDGGDDDDNDDEAMQTETKEGVGGRGGSGSGSGTRPTISSDYLCWWLNPAPDILQLDRTELVRSIIKETTRNRALQRLTQEISIDLQHAT